MKCVLELLESRQFLSASPWLSAGEGPRNPAALLVPLVSLTNVVGSYTGSIDVGGVHVQDVKVTIASQTTAGAISGTLVSVADPSVTVSLTGTVLTGNKISATLVGGGGHLGGNISGSGSGTIVVNGATTTLKLNMNFTQPFSATGTLTLTRVQPVQTTIVVTPAVKQAAIAGVSKAFALGSFAQTNATGPYSIDINWGDGSVDTKFTQAAVGSITAKSHIFTKAVTDTVSVMITDAKGHTSNKPTFLVAVTPAAAAKLVMLKTPGTTVAGKAISPAVTVAVEDKFGNIVTTNASTVTIARNTAPTGSTLTGTLAAVAVKGIATFGNLILKIAGAYTLKATDGALTAAVSPSFKVNPAAAAKLVFVKQPATGKVGSALAPPLTVAVEDAFGNVVITDKSTVKVSIFSGPAGGVLTGTLSVADLAGIASFSTLKLSKTGVYRLKAVDGLLTAATSASLTVT